LGSQVCQCHGIPRQQLVMGIIGQFTSCLQCKLPKASRGVSRG
jgi:hypothetical protein